MKAIRFVATVLRDLTKFARQTYRDGYLETKVRGGIAYQVQALRGDTTQKEFAHMLGMKQSAISRLESIEYGKVTVQTLLRIAKRLNIALVVQFVSYPEFLDRTTDMSPTRLKPETIYQSLEAQKRMSVIFPAKSTSHRMNVRAFYLSSPPPHSLPVMQPLSAGSTLYDQKAPAYSVN